MSKMVYENVSVNRTKMYGVGWFDNGNLYNDLTPGDLGAFNAYIYRKHQGHFEEAPHDFEYHGEQIVGKKDVFSIFYYNLFKSQGVIGIELARGSSVDNNLKVYKDDTDLWKAAIEETFGEEVVVFTVEHGRSVAFLECMNQGE